MTEFYDIDAIPQDIVDSIDDTGYNFTWVKDRDVLTLICRGRQIGQWSRWSLEALRDPISVVTGYVQGYLVWYEEGYNDRWNEDDAMALDSPEYE